MSYNAFFLLLEMSLFSSVQKELEQNYVAAGGTAAKNIILYAWCELIVYAGTMVTKYSTSTVVLMLVCDLL